MKFLHSRYSTWVVLIIFLALFLSIRFFPFFTGKTLFFGDNYSLMVPSKLYSAGWLRQGIVPLWNPTILGGVNWIGDINQSVLYPTVILFMIFPPSQALNWSIIFHLLITGVGMYLLTRQFLKSAPSQLLATMLWTFSTQVSGSVNNLSTIQSLAYLPWVVWAGTQVKKGYKYQALFALIVTLQLWGGYPQHVIYSILSAVIFSLWQKKANWFSWLVSWLATAFLTLTLSAFVWLPFVESFLMSTRMTQSVDQSQAGSLSPIMIIKLILPYFFDMPISGMKWGPAWSGQPNLVFYVTWLGLLMFLVNLWKYRLEKRQLFLLIICAVSLLVALGENLPGFSLLQTLLPFLRFGRYPSMILIVTNLCMALWVGLAFENFSLSGKKLQPLLIISGLGLLLISLVYWLIGTNFAHAWHWLDALLQQALTQSVFHTLERDKIITLVILSNLMINLLFFFLSLLAFYFKKKWLVVALMTLDLVYNTQGLYFFAPNQVYDNYQVQTDSDLVHILKNDQNYRLLTRNFNTPYTDYGSYWEALVVRYPFSDSFVTEKELTSFSHLEHLRNGLTPDWNMPIDIKTINGYTALLPQTTAHEFDSDGVNNINFVDPIDIKSQLISKWSVKYYLVDKWFSLSNEYEGLKLLTHDGFYYLYELDTQSRFRYFDGSETKITNLVDLPNKIEFTLNNDQGQPGLILADSFDPNWRAEVNGRPVEISDHDNLRFVPIDPGENLIVFYFWPRWFYGGLFISAVTGGGILAVCLFECLTKVGIVGKITKLRHLEH